MRSIDEVLGQPVVGNAEADARIWEDLYRIAEDETASISDRVRAIRHMDVLTGEDETGGLDDYEVIKRYAQEVSSYHRRKGLPVGGRLSGSVSVELVDGHRNHLENLDGRLHITVGPSDPDEHDSAIVQEDELRHLKIEAEGRNS